MGTTNILDMNNRISALEKGEVLTASDIMISDGVTSVEEVVENRIEANTISIDASVPLAFDTEYTTESDGFFRIVCIGNQDTWAIGEVNGITLIQATAVPTQTASGVNSIFVRKGSKIKISGKDSGTASGTFYPLQ